MTKLRFYKLLSAILLLSNVLILGWMFYGRKDFKRPEGPKKVIAERLDFDQNQMKQYESLIRTHQIEIGDLESRIFREKNAYYSSINSGDSLSKAAHEANLGRLQIQIERVNYQHFLEIKKICKLEQMPLYDALLADLAHFFTKPHKRPAKH